MIVVVVQVILELVNLLTGSFWTDCHNYSELWVVYHDQCHNYSELWVVYHDQCPVLVELAGILKVQEQNMSSSTGPLNSIMSSSEDELFLFTTAFL